MKKEKQGETSHPQVTTANPVTEPSSSAWQAAKCSMKKTLSVWASMVSTTVTFAGLLLLTLGANTYVLHPLFEALGAADPVVLLLFKGAKYLVLFLELAHWVYGVCLDCKHHHGDNDTH